ncbi:hypothetical protein ACFV2H_02445 [Streptomyces sp. NPDC059629]|uniref:hypothetical protein n=1 Tax=Streptomyces sp. NPDC059629 TaxID=3346889 RepID=UPI003680A193
MNEEFDIKIGRRVRHVDGGGRTAIVKSFYTYPLVTVEWDDTGRESTGNIAYLLPVYYKITAREVTYPRGEAVQVTAYVNSNRRGERVVVSKWTTPLRNEDGQIEHPAGTITYRRIKGVGVSVEEMEPERVVTREELHPDIAERL